MKKIITGVTFVVTAALVSSGWYLYHTNSEKVQSVNSYVQKNDYKILNEKYQKLFVKDEQSKELSKKPRNLGYKTVTASDLNIRQDASENLEPIGIMIQNSVVEAVDTSNTLWYKVKLDLSKLIQTDKKDISGRVLYTNSNGEGVCYINPKYIKDGHLSLGDQYYLFRKYLDDAANKYVYTEPPADSKHPFVYGIQFYSEEFAKTLKSELWKELSDKLIQRGYDGIKIEYADRKNVVDNMQNNYYQVVETPPIELARATMNNDNYLPFVKLVNKVNNSSEYTGVFVVNTNSNIKTPADIKGKKICFTNTSSASGYIIQKYYLKKIYNIDIDKDCTIVTKKNIYEESKDEAFQHDEIPLVVASGYADVGFCGDFVLTTEVFGDFKNYLNNKLLPYSVVGIDDENKLEKYFDDNVKVLNLLDIPPLTNNPQSMSKDLWQDDQFMKSFKSVVENTYKIYNEQYGIIDADKGEYTLAKELVKFQGK